MKKTSGFGLLEAILAIALLSIFAVGISIAFSTLGEAAIDTTEEASMINDVEALILEAGFSGRLIEFTESVESAGGWNYKVSVEQIDNLQAENGADLNDLYEVQVEATPPKNSQSVPFLTRTIIYRPAYDR